VDASSEVEEVAVDLAVESAGGAVVGSVYRPQLDGLRAVAVYLVVLFHAGSSWFSGGYIGVDVFFVLSGFLVTQLLLRDIVGSGRVRFSRFYARRFRRLLPAAFVALIVTAMVFSAIASPAEVLAAAGSFKAAFLYATNWYFIHQAAGYFGANINTNPVLQFWSLAVEEQFYLFWPIALGGLFLFTRRLEPGRQLRVIRTVIVIAAAASAIWALSLRNTDPNHAYYGTDTRAYELLAGAFLALIPQVIDTARQHQRALRVAAATAIVALIAISTSSIHLDAIQRGIAATLTTTALIVTLETAERGVVKRALSNNTIVYLGKISYGTYLWHWIVILVATRTFQLHPTTTIAVTVGVATALASLSYQLLEHPIRTSQLLNQHRYPVIAAGLTISLISAVVLIPHLVDTRTTTSTVTGAITTGFTKVPPNLDWQDAGKNLGPFTNCYRQPVTRCTTVHGTGLSILLIGDSHAHMLIPTLTAIAKQDNLTLSIAVKGGCPWQQNLYAPEISIPGKTNRPQDCKAQKDDLYNRVIPQLNPDIIIAMNLAYENPIEPLQFMNADGQTLIRRSSSYYPEIEAATKQSIAAMSDGGRRKVVLLEPIPVTRFNPLDCLSKATYIEQCRYVASALPDRLEQFFRSLAKHDRNVWSINLDKLVCPFLPICDPIVNGQIVKWDPTHLTVKFAQSIAPELNTYLQQNNILTK
jgi:peptidoglycan/LPS O-acetylase OafA/YrhL